MMCRTQGFMSDLATVLMGAGAHVVFTVFATGKSIEVDLHSFLHKADDAKVDKDAFLVTAVIIPHLAPNEHFRTYRQATRAVNAHALVNAAFRVSVDASHTITAATFAFGCIDHAPVYANAAEKAVLGHKVSDKTAIAKALSALGEVALKAEKEYVTTRSPTGIDGYRRALMEAFLFKFFVSVSKGCVA
jgi:xanthine dehydrogenase/oxidase